MKSHKLTEMNTDVKVGKLACLALLFYLCSSVFICGQTAIRISGDSSVRYVPALIDSNTLQSVQWVRGDAVTVEVGLFDRGIFVSNNMSRFASVTLQLYQTQ